MERRTPGVVTFISLLMGVTLALSPVAWGASQTIVQWDWFDKISKEGGPWWTYVEEHLKDNWGVDFEMGIGWDEAKVPISISSGVVIDGIQIPFHQAANWTELGLLYPITDFLERDETISVQDFVPGSFDPVTMDGEIYALPWIMDFELILVNVDLFRELGIDRESPATGIGIPFSTSPRS